MRERPFLAAGEEIRPYSEIVAERRADDPNRHAWSEIRRLEGEAAAAIDPAQAKRLQCEAEAWRCQLYEQQKGNRR